MTKVEEALRHGKEISQRVGRVSVLHGRMVSSVIQEIIAAVRAEQQQILDDTTESLHQAIEERAEQQPQGQTYVCDQRTHAKGLPCERCQLIRPEDLPQSQPRGHVANCPCCNRFAYSRIPDCCLHCTKSADAHPYTFDSCRPGPLHDAEVRLEAIGNFYDELAHESMSAVVHAIITNFHTEARAEVERLRRKNAET